MLWHYHETTPLLLLWRVPLLLLLLVNCNFPNGGLIKFYLILSPVCVRIYLWPIAIGILQNIVVYD